MSAMIGMMLTGLGLMVGGAAIEGLKEVKAAERDRVYAQDRTALRLMLWAALAVAVATEATAMLLLFVV